MARVQLWILQADLSSIIIIGLYIFTFFRLYRILRDLHQDWQKTKDPACHMNIAISAFPQMTMLVMIFQVVDIEVLVSVNLREIQIFTE